MTYDTIGEAFMRPLMEGIRAGQSQQRINVSQKRLAQEGDMENARLQNMQIMNQMRMMILQKQLMGMKQGQALKLAQLQQSQNDYNEKIREFNINEQDKLKGVGAGAGRSTAELTNLNAAKAILDKWNAHDAQGNPDLNKITNGFDLDSYNKLMGAAEKGSSDAATRTRYVKGVQLQNTINQIDPQVLANYSGAQGKAKLATDLATAKSTGVEPEQLKQYKAIVNTLIPTVEGQATGYWGTSITPEEQDKIANMVNASSNWLNNPDDVLQEFSTFKDMVNSELAISSAALTDGDFYTNPNSGINAVKNVPSASSMAQPALSAVDIATGAAYLAKQYNKSIKDAMKVFNGLTSQQQQEVVSEAQNGS
jgi:hypothetical protein